LFAVKNSKALGIRDNDVKPYAINACPVHGVFYVKLQKIYGTLFLQIANYVHANNSYFP